MSESYRTFIAIELPHAVRSRVVAHLNQLRQSAPEVAASWIGEDSLHLTLKFLGEVPVNRIDDLSNAVAAAAAHVDKFPITIVGWGAFPPRGKPNVLWIGIEEKSGTLSQLHQDLEKTCAAIGFERAARSFHPHLTIARIRKPHGARDLANLHSSQPFPPMSFTVPAVTTFKSELLKSGAKHIALFQHQLSGRSLDAS